MDADLPVWSIRPNWASGITETLEWLTDVSTSDTGTEQRTARRLSPRRSFEATYNPVRNERTFLSLILDRFVAQPFYYPLWHDKARLTSGVAAGGNRVEFDNTFREFTDGGLAILYRDAFDYEVISIATQDDTGLDLAVPLDGAWSVRSVIYPIRKALMDPSSNFDALTSRVGQAQLRFMVNEANDYEEAFIGMLSYADRPIISIETDRADPLTVSYQRMIDELDNDTGIIRRNDLAGRSFTQQAQTWHVRGRQAHHEFRAMLYALRGRQKSVWLPTWNDDVFVSRDAAQGAVNLDIERVGYSYVGEGQVIPGKEYLWFGDQVLMVTAVGAAQSPQEDRLRIGGGLQAPVARGRSASFLQAARLDQDSVELHHETDSDGVLTCQAAFRTFNDNRDPTGAIYTPLPNGQMTQEGCGSPEPGSCITAFSGWYWHIQWKEMTSGGIEGDAAWCLVRDLDGNTVGNSESSSGYAYSNVGAPGGWQRDWKFSYDFPPDWRVSIRTQYARGTDFGNITEACGDPTDPRPVVYVYAQHWSQSSMHLVTTGCQGTLFPVDFEGRIGG
jgi:hypothetical protein